MFSIRFNQKEGTVNLETGHIAVIEYNDMSWMKIRTKSVRNITGIVKQTKMQKIEIDEQ